MSVAPRSGVARAQELGRDAPHERAPALARRDVGVERERVVLPQVGGVRGDRVVGAVGRLHRHARGDGERQAQAVVVVGVLADEVHAAGPEGADRAHRTPRSIVKTTNRMMTRTARLASRGAQTATGERPARRRGPVRVRWSPGVSGVAPAARS